MLTYLRGSLQKLADAGLVQPAQLSQALLPLPLRLLLRPALGAAAGLWSGVMLG